MVDSKIESFYTDFGTALKNRKGVLFAGAGLSVASGYVNWKGLLSGIAGDLHLDIDRENDLVALAQYHVNERGSRAKLTDRIVREFAKHAKITKTTKL
jgi:hypothetical protein